MILCIGTTPAAQRVMVFKSLAIDRVNRAVQTLDGAAGKSVNVAKVLKRLGEEPLAAGFIGGDRGEFLRQVLASEAIATSFVTVAARTRQCITVVDQAAGSVTELVEESPGVDPGDYEALWSSISGAMQHCRAAVMSGTLAPGGAPDFYYRCVRAAAEAGALAVVDAQGEALERTLAASPGVVKPNLLELAATVRRKLADEPAVLAAMREVSERGARNVVVTAGAQPTLAFDGARAWRIHPPPVSAVNPIGSGDAFTAGMVWRLIKGEGLEEACRWAAAAGAANALTLMAGEVEKETVERLGKEVRVERVNL